MNSFRTLMASFAVLVLLPVSVAAQSGVPEDVARGRKIWDKKRCQACHGIGWQYGGPDLAGLAERRTRDWLYRWLKDSKSMVRTDSIGRELLARNNNVVMPNQRLSPREVDALLAFIAYEEELMRARKAEGRLSP
jgi:mono/diheme cytochrome c family protein